MEHTISILYDCRTVEVKLYNVEIGNTSCDITYHIYNENDFKKFFDNIIVDGEIEQYIKNYLFVTNYSGYSEDCEKKVLQCFDKITKDILMYPTLKRFVVEYKHKCESGGKDVILTNVANTPIEITKVKDESIFRFDYNKSSDEDAGYIFVHIDDTEEKERGLHKYDARILVNKNKDNNIGSITRFLSKIHSAYNDYYKDKQGYQVTGSVPKTPLISAIMSKQNFNYRCKVIPTAIKGKFSKQTVNNMTTTNGLSLIPIGAKNHATLLIVEKTNDNTTTYLYSLIDTSLQHIMLSNKKQVVRGIFSGFNDEEIDVLLDSPLQINGCCSYWADSFMEDIIMNPEKYTDMESIKNAMDDGSLILEACCIMSKIFDEHGKEIVKKFDANEEENDDYFMFEIAGGEKYGINKNCWSNKFVNIESLINLSLKTKTSTRDNFMEQLKVQIEKQKIIRPIEVAINSVQKIQKKGSDGFDVFNVLLQKFNDIEKYDKTLYEDLLSNLRTHGRMLSGCLETNNKELSKESTQFDFLIDLINQKSVLDNNSTYVRGLIELYGQNGIMEKYLNDLKQYLMKNEGLEQLENNDNYKNIREQQKKKKMVNV